MQYPNKLLHWKHCKCSRTEKLGQAALAQSYTRQCGFQGISCELAMSFPSAADISQHIPNEIRQVSAHRVRQRSLDKPRWSFFPDKALFSFPSLRQFYEN